jgi:hypothetical protein
MYSFVTFLKETAPVKLPSIKNPQKELVNARIKSGISKTFVIFNKFPPISTQRTRIYVV